MFILASGYNGFLGKTIYNRLIRQYKIFTIGRSPSSNIFYDFSADRLLNVTLRHKYGVIHAAGKAHIIPRANEEKEMFWKVNLEGTKNLCKGLENSGNLPADFIFISTVSVYGLEEGSNVDEKYPLNGRSDYARSKIEAEQWLTTWAKKYGVRLLILRLPLVAGPNPPGNLGAMIQGIKSGRYFRIGDGKARKSIVLAADVAEIIARSMGKEGVYNLTDGYHPSFFELEELIASQLGKKPPLSIPLPLAKFAAGAGDILGNKFPVNSSRLSKIVNSLTFSDDKARRELAWDPHRVVDEFRIC